MPDPRSAMKEYRYLDEKRRAQGLTPDEAARYARLRDLVRPDAGGGAQPGFDVNAAAARLRESLLPAGLRNRPPPTPSESSVASPGSSDDLASIYREQRIGRLDGAMAALEATPAGGDAAPGDPSAEPAWDPGQPWDPAAQAPGDAHEAAAAEAAAEPLDPDAWYGADGEAYDPNAQYAPGAEPLVADGQPYDPNVQAYDPNTTYDPNAVYAPNAQPYDAGAQPFVTGGEAYDPNAQAYDPNLQAYDPNATYDPNAPFDPNAQPYDAGAEPFVTGGEAYDPNAQAYDPNLQAYDPNATYDPNAPFDPNAQPYDAGTQPFVADGQPYDPNAQAYDPNLQAYDPNATYDPNAPYDPNAQPYGADAPPYEPDAEAFREGAGGPELEAFDRDGPALELDAQPLDPAALELAGTEAPWDPELTPGPGAADATAPDGGAPPDAEPSPAAAGWRDDDAALPPPGWDSEPLAFEPAGDAPAGEYDETGALVPAPGDPAILPSPEEASPPHDPGDPSPGADAPLEGATPELGEYDDTAGFDGTLPPGEAGADPAAGGFEARPAAELHPARDGGAPEADAASPTGEAAGGPAWQPEAALDGGFRLESAGSFGAGAGAAPAAWESAPPLDLGAAPGDPGDPGDPGGPPDARAPDAATLDFDVDAADAADAARDLELTQADFSVDEVSLEPLASPEELRAGAAATPAPEPEPGAPGEDVPTIEGEDILEELPEEALSPAAPAPSPAGPEQPAVAPLARDAAPEPAHTAPAAAPDSRVAGTHRVVVHTVEGLVKRGVLADPELAGPTLELAPQPDAAAEAIATEGVKAVFFMLAPGEAPPAGGGRKIRVTFRDGRQIAGFSDDYRETGTGFFIVPGDPRTNTGRIWVYRSAVKQVAVS